MENESFYAECAALLGCSYDGKPFPHYKRNRWNNRAPGQGRYEGHGIIRVFGDTVHVALTQPKINMISTKEEVLARLRDLAINSRDENGRACPSGAGVL